ncbi:sulfotransferase [Sphingomonas suaedae]|uniref:Sulfotransferase n=1 Tax=Sphingomonas suaedae TaxID=2599297 RepID=A0A518RHS3_9SPHN|nr:sulfotransferase [Sphingomonas suaedae]
MPRSGTTLLDFVLGGHPDCTDMGELSLVPSAIASLGFGRPQFQFPTRAVLDEVAQRFQEMLRFRRIGTRYIVDKMSENYRYLPLIKALFPDAPVIHAIRHPLDKTAGGRRELRICHRSWGGAVNAAAYHLQSAIRGCACSVRLPFVYALLKIGDAFRHRLETGRGAEDHTGHRPIVLP